MSSSDEKERKDAWGVFISTLRLMSFIHLNLSLAAFNGKMQLNDTSPLFKITVFRSIFLVLSVHSSPSLFVSCLLQSNSLRSSSSLFFSSFGNSLILPNLPTQPTWIIVDTPLGPPRKYCSSSANGPISLTVYRICVRIFKEICFFVLDHRMIFSKEYSNHVTISLHRSREREKKVREWEVRTD